MLVEPGELLIPLHHVAKALGWTTELTRDRFIRAGLAVKPPGARMWSIMRHVLLAEMPLVLSRIDEMAVAGELMLLRHNRLAHRRQRQAKHRP